MLSWRRPWRVPAQAATAVLSGRRRDLENEYWTRRGDIPLWMYRKVSVCRRPGAGAAGRVLRARLFGHLYGVGSQSRARRILGHERLRPLGYDCWTIDLESYGKSTRNESQFRYRERRRGPEGARIVTRETGQQKIHLIGSSSGAFRAAAYAAAPERVGRIVLGAYTYTGRFADADQARRAGRLLSTNNTRKRDRDMIRRSPHATSPARAIQPRRGAGGCRDAVRRPVPTGTYLDMTSNLPIMRPEKVRPGFWSAADMMASPPRRPRESIHELPNPDRQLIIWPAPPIRGPRYQPSIVLARDGAFLTMPAPIAM